MAHLHLVDLIAHGDIKIDNILVTSSLTLALNDFGHSMFIDRLTHRAITNLETFGTPEYNPPEYFNRDGDFDLLCSDIF